MSNLQLTPYQLSDAVEVPRSSITLANYNPRKITDKARALLKKNIKGVGLMGGIVWNKTTGNLIAGHQRILILDDLNGYPAKDYLIRVEVVELDLKQEKEQNIFLNNRSAMGENDLAMLATMLPDIDFKAAGLDDSDLKMIALEVPNYDFGSKEEVQNDFKQMDAPYQQMNEAQKEQRKDAIKQEKAAIKERIDNGHQEGEPFVILSFENFEHKAEFMERFGYDPYAKFIPGEAFVNSLE